MAHGLNAMYAGIARRGYEIWAPRMIGRSDTKKNRKILRKLRRAADKRDARREIDESLRPAA